MLPKPTREAYMDIAGPRLMEKLGAKAVQVVLEPEGQVGIASLRDALYAVKDPLLQFSIKVRDRQKQVGPLSPPASTSRQNELLNAAFEVAVGIGMRNSAVSTVSGQVRCPAL